SGFLVGMKSVKSSANQLNTSMNFSTAAKGRTTRMFCTALGSPAPAEAGAGVPSVAGLSSSGFTGSTEAEYITFIHGQLQQKAHTDLHLQRTDSSDLFVHPAICRFHRYKSHIKFDSLFIITKKLPLQILS